MVDTNPKMIPEGALIAFKKQATERERALKRELEESKKRLVALEAEMSAVNVDASDDDAVAKAKRELLAARREIQAQKDELDKGLASQKERERKLLAKELSVQYGIDLTDIEDEEDVEGTALKRYADKLAEENKKLKETPEKKEPETSGSVFETSVAGTVRKNVKDMNPTEFEAYEKSLKAKVGL